MNSKIYTAIPIAVYSRMFSPTLFFFAIFVVRMSKSSLYFNTEKMSAVSAHFVILLRAVRVSLDSCNQHRVNDVAFFLFHVSYIYITFHIVG